MLGITELVVIVIVAAVIFFGKDVVLDWAKTLRQVKKTYDGEIKDEPKAKKKKAKSEIEDEPTTKEEK